MRMKLFLLALVGFAGLFVQSCSMEEQKSNLDLAENVGNLL